MWGKDGVIKQLLTYWQNVNTITEKKTKHLSLLEIWTHWGKFHKKSQKAHVNHTSVYFLGFQNWLHTGRNQSRHVTLTVIWWHFHGAPAVIAAEQTAVLAPYWSHTAVLFKIPSAKDGCVDRKYMFFDWWTEDCDFSFSFITELDDHFCLG